MIISRSTHIAANGIISFVLIFHHTDIYICIYTHTTSSLSVFCQWTFRLLPCLCYCKQCCCEWTPALFIHTRSVYKNACMFSNYSFLQINAQEWNAQEWNQWIMWYWIKNHLQFIWDTVVSFSFLDASWVIHVVLKIFMSLKCLLIFIDF